MESFSVLGQFDKLMRDVMDTLNIVPRVMDAYMDALVECQNLKIENKRGLEERVILLELLKEKETEATDLQNQMRIVRRLVDEEKSRRKRADLERDHYKLMVEQFSFSKKSEKEYNLHSHSKEYNRSTENDPANNASDLQTTGSIMDDLSFTRDENDFDYSYHESRSRRETSNVKMKKRRSSSAIRYSELVPKENMISSVRSTAETDPLEITDKNLDFNSRAVPEYFLQNKNQEFVHTVTVPVDSASKLPTTPKLNNQFLNTLRSHDFQQKTILTGGTCSVCFKRLRFSALGYKCRDCKTLCHVLCKDNVHLPCLFNGNTPRKVRNVELQELPKVYWEGFVCQTNQACSPIPGFHPRLATKHRVFFETP